MPAVPPSALAALATYDQKKAWLRELHARYTLSAAEGLLAMTLLLVFYNGGSGLDDEMRCFPGMAAVGAYTGLSTKTIQRALSRLKGIIQRSPSKKHRSNSYFFFDPSAWPDELPKRQNPNNFPGGRTPPKKSAAPIPTMSPPAPASPPNAFLLPSGELV